MKPYISDYHIHSHHSGDSDESIQAIINKALLLNMQSICFTDHMDYDFPPVEPGLDFNLNIDEYTKELLHYKELYKDKLDIRIGIELGMQPHISKENYNIIKSFPFDFVIASTHVVDRSDPYYPIFWESRSVKECLDIYFNDILTCIKSFDDFDVYGHLDYIIRYIPKNSITFSYKDYSDIIDEILRTLIGNGKGIEANTAGFRCGLSSTNPSLDILKRYRELGGSIITIGSDAHKAEYIGGNFEDAKKLLGAAGFSHYNTFKERKYLTHNF